MPAGKERVPIYNVYDFPYSTLFTRISTASNRKGMYYINVPCAFDIETTSIVDEKRSTVEQTKYLGFMYIWQFCFIDTVVMGRTWEEFTYFLDKLKEFLDLASHKRLVIYVHYLAFEFQFMRNFLNIESVFARKKRVPMKVLANEAFEFRCSYFLSNMSLDKFIKNTPQAKFFKQSGDDFDYHVRRLPTTKLTNNQLGYCYCDVRGLCECISYLMIEDTLATIPLTSTGFLRRDVRQAVLANPFNRKHIKQMALTPELYVLCKTASRGGNTHANAVHSNQIIYDMKSKDRKSSYPAEMVVDNYPVTPFRIARPTQDNIESLTNEYACLIDITLFGVSLKKVQVMPYLAVAKCLNVSHDAIIDNGRIAHCTFCSMVCTDVDFNIIRNQYDYDYMEVRSIHVAEYGKLNNEFRNLLMDYFMQKCLLENGDPYLYAKFKNKINAFFGMMLTDICNPEIIYTGSAIEPWGKGDFDLYESLKKHYNSKKTFLSFQHGIWVTANARKRLQDALDIVDDDGVYCDTDSVKYLGDHEEDFKKLNEEWLSLCDNNDIKPYVDHAGKRTYLGTWEDDGSYSTFKTLGAKKYAYTLSSDPQQNLHITVAGLSKKKGAEYLDTIGGIDAFNIGTIVPKDKSGRTVAYYNDTDVISQITIDDCTFTIGSNVAVIDAEYTFGISDDYYDYLTTMENITDEIKGEIYYEADLQTDN